MAMSKRALTEIEDALEGALPADNGMRSLRGEEYVRDNAVSWLRRLVGEVKRLQRAELRRTSGRTVWSSNVKRRRRAKRA